MVDAPTVEQRIRWLEQGLGGLDAAIRALTGHIDQEHIDAMDRAWEAGDQALTKLVSENPV